MRLRRLPRRARTSTVNAKPQRRRLTSKRYIENREVKYLARLQVDIQAVSGKAPNACQCCSKPKIQKEKPDSFESGFQINSLTMSYFHTGIRTIIGAKAFHCPVRDGKELDHLAMVIRLDLSPCCSWRQHGKFIESEIS